jgi:hypothetical protein
METGYNRQKLDFQSAILNPPASAGGCLVLNVSMKLTDEYGW